MSAQPAGDNSPRNTTTATSAVAAGTAGSPGEILAAHLWRCSQLPPGHEPWECEPAGRDADGGDR